MSMLMGAARWSAEQESVRLRGTTLLKVRYALLRAPVIA